MWAHVMGNGSVRGARADAGRLGRRACLAAAMVVAGWVVVRTTHTAIARSTDGGQTWQQAYTQPNTDGTYQTTGLEVTVLRSVTQDPADTRRMFFGYTDIGLFMSADGGVTMRRRVGSIPRVSANSAYAVVIDPSNRQHLWASFGPHETESTGFLIAESADSGENWTTRTVGLPDRYYRRLRLDDSRSPRRLLVVAREAGIYVSDDGAATWSASNTGLSHGDLRDLVADPSRPGTWWTVLAGRGSEPAVVHRSEDRGTSWQRVSGSSLQAWDVKQLAVSRTTLYLAARQAYVDPRTYAGGIYASEDGGVTWRLVLEDPFAEAVAVDPADPRTVYAGLTDHPYHDDSRGNGLKVSRDGGATWTTLPTPSGRISALALDRGDPARLFVGTNGTGAGIVDLRSTANRRRP